MEVPIHIQEGLSNIREGLHLRWNPRSTMVETGSFDSTGKAKEPVYEGRFELWDTDPDGAEYMIMRIQDVDGGFRMPGEWLVERIWKLHPARYNGDIRKLVLAQIDDPDTLREIGTTADSDALIDAVVDWAKYVATPKSGAALSYRGKRLFST